LRDHQYIIKAKKILSEDIITEFVISNVQLTDDIEGTELKGPQIMGDKYEAV